MWPAERIRQGWEVMEADKEDGVVPYHTAVRYFAHATGARPHTVDFSQTPLFQAVKKHAKSTISLYEITDPHGDTTLAISAKKLLALVKAEAGTDEAAAQARRVWIEQDMFYLPKSSATFVQFMSGEKLALRAKKLLKKKMKGENKEKEQLPTPAPSSDESTPEPAPTKREKRTEKPVDSAAAVKKKKRKTDTSAPPPTAPSVLSLLEHQVDAGTLTSFISAHSVEPPSSRPSKTAKRLPTKSASTSPAPPARVAEKPTARRSASPSTSRGPANDSLASPAPASHLAPPKTALPHAAASRPPLPSPALSTTSASSLLNAFTLDSPLPSPSLPSSASASASPAPSSFPFIDAKLAGLKQFELSTLRHAYARAQCEGGAAFVALDVEMWERDKEVLLEFGWSISEFRKKSGGKGEVECRREDQHVVIRENMARRNGRWSPDARDHFDFGQTLFLNQSRLHMLLSALFDTLSSTQPVFLIFHDPRQDLIALRGLGFDSSVEFQRDLHQFAKDVAKGRGEEKGKVWVADTQRLFESWMGRKVQIGLERACNEIGVETRRLHNAGNDAHYTLDLFERMMDSSRTISPDSPMLKEIDERAARKLQQREEIRAKQAALAAEQVEQERLTRE
ncbi:hypothetical protein JCM8547_007385 [Rhodosporidiobolus lusitaniae]